MKSNLKRSEIEENQKWVTVGFDIFLNITSLSSFTQPKVSLLVIFLTVPVLNCFSKQLFFLYRILLLSKLSLLQIRYIS